MEITYQLTKEDCIAFNVHHMGYSPTLKRALFIQRYIASLVFLILPFILKGSSDIPFPYWLSVFVIVYIAWVVFYNRYMEWNITRKISKMVDEGKNSNMLGERTLKLVEDGMIQSSSLSESKTTWDAIVDVIETGEHIFIYTSSLAGYVIPVEVFDTVAEKDEFLNIVRAHIEE